MSKSYLLLIALLLLVILGVGAFAYSKTTTQPSSKTSYPSSPSTTESTQTQPVPPTTSQSDVNPSKNTLTLSVISPQDNLTVSTPTILVSGTTVPDADVAVNDKDLKANSLGKFSTTVPLEEGENYILVVASNEIGAAEWEGVVTYTPSQ